MPLPAVSLSPPAVRMVVLLAWAEPAPAEEGGWTTSAEVLPVLALSARVTAEGDVDYQPVILCPDGSGLMAADYLDHWCDGYRAVACPWPPEDDAVRLAGPTHDLENRVSREAHEKVEKQAMRELAKADRN